MIVLGITSLDHIEADKKDAVWYQMEPVSSRVFRVIVDNHVVAYTLSQIVVSESDFLLMFPNAKRVSTMTAESGIN